MKKLITDSKGTEIRVGSVVKHRIGWVRITRLNSKWCNLGAVWGHRVYEKMVPLTDIIEDEAAWWKAWQQTDAYRCG